MRSEDEEGNKEDVYESSRWSWNSRSSSDRLIDSSVKCKPPFHFQSVVDDDDDDESKFVEEGSEFEMMKERFTMLLLGEDMSGHGNGVCSASAISNAITNLYATIFGQLWRLEPLLPEKKSMWQREMGWLLCVSDYIVEMIPAWHKLPDGSSVEIMSSRQRSDLLNNLPVLRILDNMLLEILDEFTDPEFWYMDQDIATQDAGKPVSLQKAIHQQGEKWGMPMPCVPSSSLTGGTRNHLSQKLECASQILKTASTIHSSVLADMEVPESYSEALPKSGKICLGNVIYRYITSEKFSSDRLLDCLDLSSESAALELANRVESAIQSWIINKKGLVVQRAENLLLTIKQRYPGLTQTALDSCKIRYNKDVGKSILESYSRVLESLASSIVARIEDLLCVDDITKKQKHKHSSEKSLVSFPVPISGTNRTSYSTSMSWEQKIGR